LGVQERNAFLWTIGTEKVAEKEKKRAIGEKKMTTPESMDTNGGDDPKRRHRANKKRSSGAQNWGGKRLRRVT